MPDARCLTPLALAAVAACPLAVAASAQIDEAPRPGVGPGAAPAPVRFEAIWENDGGPIRPGGPDRHYTNGLLLTLAHQPAWSDNLADALGLRYDATAAGYLLGHQIFTPENISLPAPPADDRPYAGYLFGGVYWQREQDNALDHLQLDLGIVGPSAGGEDLQTAVHEIFNADDPKGWDAQIEDTFTFQFTYRKKWRIDLNEPAAGEARAGLSALDWQLLPQVGFGLGNVYRQAEAAATLRFGQNLPDDFGPARVADARSATGLGRELASARAGAASKWSWSIFGRAGVRLVQHNLFLDGPDSGGGPAVESEPIVGEFSAGVTAAYRFDNHWRLELEYTQTVLTDAFKGQDTFDGFATLLLALRATW